MGLFFFPFSCIEHCAPVLFCGTDENITFIAQQEVQHTPTSFICCTTYALLCVCIYDYLYIKEFLQCLVSASGGLWVKLFRLNERVDGRRTATGECALFSRPPRHQTAAISALPRALRGRFSSHQAVMRRGNVGYAGSWIQSWTALY